MKRFTAHSPKVLLPARWMGCFFALFFLHTSAMAQLQVSEDYGKRAENRLETLIVSPTNQLFPSKYSKSFQIPPLQADGIWLPEYARENPAGHAPLCRIETGLENRLSIPLWIRAGEVQNMAQFGTGNLYLRMKLLRF